MGGTITENGSGRRRKRKWIVIHSTCGPVQLYSRGCSVGLLPTEARGNYLPETKTYLNCNSRMQCMGTSNM